MPINPHHQCMVLLKTRPWLHDVIQEAHRIKWVDPEMGEGATEAISTLLALFFQVLNQVLSDDLFDLARNRRDASETLIAMLMSEFEGYGNIPQEFTPEQTDIIIAICVNLLDDLIASVDSRHLRAGTQFIFARLVAYDILVQYNGESSYQVAPLHQQQQIYQELITYDHDTTHERQWV